MDERIFSLRAEMGGLELRVGRKEKKERRKGRRKRMVKLRMEWMWI